MDPFHQSVVLSKTSTHTVPTKSTAPRSAAWLAAFSSLGAVPFFPVRCRAKENKIWSDSSDKYDKWANGNLRETIMPERQVPILVRLHPRYKVWRYGINSDTQSKCCLEMRRTTASAAFVLLIIPMKLTSASSYPLMQRRLMKDNVCMYGLTYVHVSHV